MSVSAGDMLLETFKSQSIEYIFCSPGTEWVPVWEGLARQYSQGDNALKYVNCRHEGIAVSMASGYAKATGRLPAVLLHDSVGPLHAAMELRAACRARTPMIICTGESSRYGEDDAGYNPQWLGRLSDIGGSAALVRPYVKWSNSVTTKETLVDSLYRGCQIARTPPRGAVLVAIPWEFLLETLPEMRMPPPSPQVVLPEPRPADVDQVVKLLADSEHPVIITEYAGENPENVQKLTDLAELLSIPVFEGIDPAFSNFPRNHPLHAGFDASGALREADTVFIVAGTTPWHPPSAFPREGTKVILLDEGVLKAHLPYWGYRVDLVLTGDVGQWLEALVGAARNRVNQPQVAAPRGQKRFEYWQSQHEERIRGLDTQALAEQRNKPISPRWFLHTLDRILPADSIVLDETVTHRLLIRQYMSGRYVKVGAGGLGTGLGMAAGVKLALRDKPVVLLVGDGTFNYNPVAAGLGVYQEYGLPVLTVIFNNGGYTTMRRGHQGCYPEGWAVKSNRYLGVDIAPEPDYARLAEAFDAYGRRVEGPDDIEPAVKEALRQTTNGKAALLDVVMDRRV